ncbi:transposase [Streptomyces subrutilus]|uniref:transposase n=1 Tax=Streptomyces subrutilus TaxID=36818 RepID=UPI003570A79C
MGPAPALRRPRLRADGVPSPPRPRHLAAGRRVTADETAEQRPHGRHDTTPQARPEAQTHGRRTVADRAGRHVGRRPPRRPDEAVHQESDGTHGAPRIIAELRQDSGEAVNHQRVTRISRRRGGVVPASMEDSSPALVISNRPTTCGQGACKRSSRRPCPRARR